LHKYRIPKAVVSNSVTWGIQSDLTLSPAIQHNLTALDAGASWITIGSENVLSVDYAFIELKFITGAPVNFASGQTWYLIYSEWDNTAGTGNCVARRSMRIDIVDNSFYLTMDGDFSDCNSLSGRTWSNIDDLTDDRNGIATFTVEMFKAQTFHVRQWVFEGTFNITGTGYDAAPTYPDLSGITAHGNWILSGSGNTFTLTVTVTDPVIEYEGGTNPDDAVTFDIGINGPAINDVVVTIEITEAYAISGTLYNTRTDDNGTGNFDQAQTLWGIPNTSLVMVDP
jgi:hypothetical protein